MARKFVVSLDLLQNELLNARIQNLSTAPSSPVTGQIYYNTGSDKLRIYANGSWVDVAASSITINGTTNEVTVSASGSTYTISLPDTINANTTGSAASLTTSRNIVLSGDVSGSASFNGTADANISVAIAANSVALGTDTTGDYVAGISAGTGIGVAGSGGEGSTVTVSNTGVTAITGTTNEVDVSASTGSVTISLPATINANLNGNAASATYATTAGTANAVAANSVALGTDTTGNYVASVTGTTNEIEVSGSGEGAAVTIGLPESVTLGNLNVTGALTVSGSATYVNTEIVVINDNIIILNANATGSATQDAGIEIERGDDTNVSLLWNETSDAWTVTNDGTNYHNVVRKYSTNVGNSASTQFTITHNLGTRDVLVQVYDNATYETVEVDVVRTSTSVVTITFATAPSSNAYRVVVTG